MGAVAMGFKLYMEMDGQGKGATVSDAEFQVACGVSDGACRTFKRWLVNAGFIQIVVRGRRGYRSEFLATIPEDHIAAAAAAWKAEHKLSNRQPIPVENHENHASLPATTAAIPSQGASSCARIEPPSGVNNIIKQTTTTTVESEAEGGSGGFDFDALNGTAVDLIAFISTQNSVDKLTARNMLASNVRIFGAEPMMEAFAVTMAEMPSGCIAKPYKYLIETARGIKNGTRKKSTPAEPQPSKSQSRRENFRKISEQVRIEKQGGGYERRG